jgi:hypothetical protein
VLKLLVGGGMGRFLAGKKKKKRKNKIKKNH